MVMSKKTVVVSLALIIIICVAMNTAEAKTIGNGALAGDDNPCVPPNCNKQPANPYKPG